MKKRIKILINGLWKKYVKLDNLQFKLYDEGKIILKVENEGSWKKLQERKIDVLEEMNLLFNL